MSNWAGPCICFFFIQISHNQVAISQRPTPGRNYRFGQACLRGKAHYSKFQIYVRFLVRNFLKGLPGLIQHNSSFFEFCVFKQTDWQPCLSSIACIRFPEQCYRENRSAIYIQSCLLNSTVWVLEFLITLHVFRGKREQEPILEGFACFPFRRLVDFSAQKYKSIGARPISI